MAALICNAANFSITGKSIEPITIIMNMNDREKVFSQRPDLVSGGFE